MKHNIKLVKKPYSFKDEKGELKEGHSMKVEILFEGQKMPVVLPVTLDSTLKKFIGIDKEYVESLPLHSVE